MFVAIARRKIDLSNDAIVTAVNRSFLLHTELIIVYSCASILLCACKILMDVPVIFLAVLLFIEILHCA